MNGKNGNLKKLSVPALSAALFFCAYIVLAGHCLSAAVLTSDTGQEQAAAPAQEGTAAPQDTAAASEQAAQMSQAAETQDPEAQRGAGPEPGSPAENIPDEALPAQGENSEDNGNPQSPDAVHGVTAEGLGEESMASGTPPIESVTEQDEGEAPTLSENDIVVTGAPSSAAQEEKPAEKTAEEPAAEDGKNTRISLDLKGIDIIELLRLLSIKTGYTIVPSREVAGRINIFLNNITFDDALEIILVSQNLAAERKNNIIRVMTNNEYKNLYGRDYNEKRRMEWVKLQYANPVDVFDVLKQVKSDVGKIIADQTSGVIILIDTEEKLNEMMANIKALDTPVTTQVFELQYGKVKDLKEQLESMISKGPGKVSIDERTNKAVIADLPERMNDIRRAITAFDESTRQVFIEAEIVQVVLNREYRRGISWELLRSKLDSLDLTGTFTSTFTGANQEISVGTVATDKYNAVLQLLKIYGDTKVLSRPKLAVLNNEEAKILVGTKEAYVTQTLSQGDTTTVTSENIEFIDVGVKLNVVPTINKDGFISMKIKPEVSTVLETLETSLGSEIPIVETTESETVVKIKDGNTIIIGGLMKEEKTDTVQGLPILSRLPFVGMLFCNRYAQNRNTETIVFITPHIITGESGKERLQEQLKPATLIETPETKAVSQELKPFKELGEDQEESPLQGAVPKKQVVPTGKTIIPKGVIKME
jgi:type II secretory pathway component GspD/PulD (secretin)